MGDITNESVRKQLVDETVAKFGKLDILVNNAGQGVIGSASCGDLAVFDKVFDLNVRRLASIFIDPIRKVRILIYFTNLIDCDCSVVHLTSLAIPHLKKTHGSIVNLGSVAGMQAVRFLL